MDALDLLRTQVTGLRRDFTTILGDMTSEQAHWRPPGVANPIVSLLIHAVDFQDSVVNRTAQGKPRIWDSGNWGQKLKMDPVSRQDLEKGRALKLDFNLVKQYVTDVQAASDAYLASLKASDLDRMVTGFRGEVPLGNMLSSALVIHLADHMGEMAALKGCQGGKGWAG
ncbi:MAG: DinB family protein [SAR202 cluster bacterium]|nr:DinB family protein [SAR202 cluster bacterium]